jgi:hypothetical protein
VLPTSGPIMFRRAADQSRQKSLNRFGASAVKTALLVIER